MRGRHWRLHHRGIEAAHGAGDGNAFLSGILVGAAEDSPGAARPCDQSGTDLNPNPNPNWIILAQIGGSGHGTLPRHTCHASLGSLPCAGRTSLPAPGETPPSEWKNSTVNLRPNPNPN